MYRTTFLHNTQSAVRVETLNFYGSIFLSPSQLSSPNKHTIHNFTIFVKRNLTLNLSN